MESHNSTENNFLTQLTNIVKANINNPQFGVSMLAKEMGMSRSNLYLKVNAKLKITVTQFINQARLKEAKEILQHTSITVSEVAYEVGFSSVSYFIKCFREYYGYSPGEIQNREKEDNRLEQPVYSNRKVFISIISILVIAVALILIFKPLLFQQKKLEKSIILLQVENEVNNNSIITNGVLQSIRDNLSRINGINLKPQLAVLQAKNSPNSPLEIAQKYKTDYLIHSKTRTGINGRFFLDLELIKTRENIAIKTFTYEINSNNLTTVHLDFIEDITNTLDISVSEEEQVKINKLITSNDTALIHYWEGVKILDLWRLGKDANLEEAKTCFENALYYDNKFAAACAQLAYTYFLMDYSWADNKNTENDIIYGNEIIKYAFDAMIYDPLSDLSLIAAACRYLYEQDYEKAIFCFELALDYNPYSYLAVSYLLTLYSRTENSVKTFEFALNFLNSELPIKQPDGDFGLEQIHLKLSTFYRYWGFFDDALFHAEEAIRTNPEYEVASFIKSQILFDTDEKNNFKRSINFLKDTVKTRYNHLAQSYYMVRDYPKAYAAVNKWFELEEINVADYTGMASGRLAVIFKEMGEPEKAQMLINNYRVYGESEILKNKSYILTGYHSFNGDTNRALEQLKITSQYDHVYNHILKLKDAPLYDNIRESPKFQQILTEMETRFNIRRDSIRDELKKKDLL